MQGPHDEEERHNKSGGIRHHRQVHSEQKSRRPKTKLGQLEAMLRRPNGTTIEQISKSLVWQAHSVRGVMSGTLKKKQGLTITNEKTDDGRRPYRIA
jgi:Protein of unknown function (DUF3489)